MNKTLLIAVSSTLLAFATPALAGGNISCESNNGKWMSKQDAVAKVAGMGYETGKIKTEKGCYEVYGKKDGARFEVFIHPVTGEVVKTVKK